jgi:hypothetical protein
MTLSGDDYELLTQVRDGRTTFTVVANNSELRDKLQRLYMAGYLTACEENANTMVVGGLSAAGQQVLDTRSV